MSATDGSIRCFTSKDAPEGGLRGERVVVLGYGNLGRTFALNLRDSIADPPVIGNIEDSYAKQARGEGFIVKPIAEAVANGRRDPRAVAGRSDPRGVCGRHWPPSCAEIGHPFRLGLPAGLQSDQRAVGHRRAHVGAADGGRDGPPAIRGKTRFLCLRVGRARRQRQGLEAAAGRGRRHGHSPRRSPRTRRPPRGLPRSARRADRWAPCWACR